MSTFPITRLRRLRRTDGLRGLVRETRLDLDDFVMPLFVGPEPLANSDLPGMARHSVDSLGAEADELVRLGVKGVILFGIPDEKDEDGSGAWDDDGIVQRAVRALRGRAPELVLITDVCLCEYTDHGHCGVIGDGEESTTMRRSSCSRGRRVSHARGGRRHRRAVGHDGRPRRRDPRGARRRRLSTRRSWPTRRSTPRLLRPVPRGRRVGARSSATGGATRWIRRTSREALREVRARHRRGRRHRDGQAGASLPRRHPRRARALRCTARGVQRLRRVRDGEGGGAKGWLDERRAALESLTAIKRAGADFVISYWTKELATWLDPPKNAAHFSV